MFVCELSLTKLSYAVCLRLRFTYRLTSLWH